MTAGQPISRDRAERIARAHACTNCLEYSFKKLTVAPAPASHKADLHTLWVATRTCGVCGLEQEIGIDRSGEIVYSA
jgi:hypothetical protein